MCLGCVHGAKEAWLDAVAARSGQKHGVGHAQGRKQLLLLAGHVVWVSREGAAAGEAWARMLAVADHAGMWGVCLQTGFGYLGRGHARRKKDRPNGLVLMGLSCLALGFDGRSGCLFWAY